MSQSSHDSFVQKGVKVLGKFLGRSGEVDVAGLSLEAPRLLTGPALMLVVLSVSVTFVDPLPLFDTPFLFSIPPAPLRLLPHAHQTATISLSCSPECSAGTSRATFASYNISITTSRRSCPNCILVSRTERRQQTQHAGWLRGGLEMVVQHGATPYLGTRCDFTSPPPPKPVRFVNSC